MIIGMTQVTKGLTLTSHCTLYTCETDNNVEHLLLPALMQAPNTRKLYPKLRRSAHKLMCRREWKDGS